jgi:hypothetical protein
VVEGLSSSSLADQIPGMLSSSLLLLSVFQSDALDSHMVVVVRLAQQFHSSRWKSSGSPVGDESEGKVSMIEAIRFRNSMAR